MGAHMLIDEVYLDSALPAQATAALLGERFVCTSSLTKCYGLSGLRCGWILAEPALAERIWRLNELFGVAQAHQAERLSLHRAGPARRDRGRERAPARAQPRPRQCLLRRGATSSKSRR